MKELILTIDYELFFGERTGSVQECIIEPTKKLLKILDNSNSHMTVFWDILHFYRLIELEENFPELKVDRINIEEQIIKMVKKGHDIQMHLHPHWLDAKYEGCRWIFQYDQFKLHNLSDDFKENDINTILGCISKSKLLMEEIIKKENSNYKVTTFRAGGYLIEPFDKLKESLLCNEIYIDSSVSSGLYNINGIFSYDFRFYPKATRYNFGLTPKMIQNEGNFIEIPIASIELCFFRNIYYKYLNKIKYNSLAKEIRGRGAGSTIPKKRNLFNKLISILVANQNGQFTIDTSFNEKFRYMIKKVPEYSTMILHPKFLNPHTLEILDKCLSTNKYRFISIKDFIK